MERMGFEDKSALLTRKWLPCASVRPLSLKSDTRLPLPSSASLCNPADVRDFFRFSSSVAGCRPEEVLVDARALRLPSQPMR